MLLEVIDLFKSFGGVRAVDGVTWSMDAGQTRCIIGPNGAGKSTFFQLLMGRIKADRGTILFNGMDVTAYHPFQRARLGLAVKPQNLGVFGELSVEHNLRVCLQRMKDRFALERLIKNRLEHLGLVHKSQFLAKELSHGERQWLGLGMAMATDPKLLLLDEPTAGMSSGETERTVDLIKDITVAGTSVLVVEHDMAFVRSLSAPTTVFDNGRVFVTGTLSEIERNENVQQLYLGKRGASKLRHRGRAQ